MGKRTNLHDMLCDIMTICVSGRPPNVYFQPPDNLKMSYPCIVYSLSDIDTQFADNIPYIRQRKYTLTVIDRNPDSIIVDKISELPRCSFDRSYKADNLDHWVFSIYY